MEPVLTTELTIVSCIVTKLIIKKARAITITHHNLAVASGRENHQRCNMNFQEWKGKPKTSQEW